MGQKRRISLTRFASLLFAGAELSHEAARPQNLEGFLFLGAELSHKATSPQNLEGFLFSGAELSHGSHESHASHSPVARSNL